MSNISWIFKYKNKNEGVKQIIKKFFVLDFEATCDKESRLQPQEIIEFPCLLLDSTDFQIRDTFHTYIRPIKHPVLKPFCTELTGITQDMVENAPVFSEVLSEFSKWLHLHFDGNSSVNDAIFVTCGSWDLKKMLPEQCTVSNLSIPHQMTNWINLKVAFAQATQYYPNSLKDMLQHLNMPFDGRLHSGIDDCGNICRIIVELHRRNYIFQKTTSLDNKKLSVSTKNK